MKAKSSKNRKVANRGLQLVNRAMENPELAKEIVAIRAKMDLEDTIYAESLKGMRKYANNNHCREDIIYQSREDM